MEETYCSSLLHSVCVAHNQRNRLKAESADCFESVEQLRFLLNFQIPHRFHYSALPVMLLSAAASRENGSSGCLRPYSVMQWRIHQLLTTILTNLDFHGRVYQKTREWWCRGLLIMTKRPYLMSSSVHSIAHFWILGQRKELQSQKPQRWFDLLWGKIWYHT